MGLDLQVLQHARFHARCQHVLAVAQGHFQVSKGQRLVRQGHKRFALHASTLGFAHPITGEPMRFSSPLPAEITNFMKFSKRLDKVLQNDLRIPRSDAAKKASDRRRKNR